MTTSIVIPTTVQPKYDLWKVTYYPVGTIRHTKRYYLCDDSAAAEAIINATFQDCDGVGYGIEVEHYPSIREDYPDAVIIPSLSKELKDFIAQNRPSDK